MAVIQVLLPQFGMGMKDAQIVAWRKKPGDRVASGEILVEVEAAKSIIEVPSPTDGELLEILVNEGDVVEVRAAIAHLRTD